MIWAFLTSLIANIGLVIYLAVYISNSKKLIQNKDILESWMTVFNALHNANGVICIMKKIDPETIYFREPPR
jgi:hypothetical protein